MHDVRLGHCTANFLSKHFHSCITYRTSHSDYQTISYVVDLKGNVSSLSLKQVDSLNIGDTVFILPRICLLKIGYDVNLRNTIRILRNMEWNRTICSYKYEERYLKVVDDMTIVLQKFIFYLIYYDTILYQKH